jgi:hypothetical protein
MIPIPLLIEGLHIATKIGVKYMEKRAQKPIQEWSDNEALKWLRDYEKELDETTTDKLLGIDD